MNERRDAVHCICKGEGHAILFIHGMPTNGMLWQGVIQQLSRQYRCFAVDLPGMGETPFTPYGFDYLERMASQIEKIRIQNGVRNWHVVGHDAGSAIAVQYAGLYPQNVACLALLSPAIFPELKVYFLLNPLCKPLLGEMLAPLVHWLFWKVAMRRAIGKSSNKVLCAFYRPFSGLTGIWRFMRLVRWGKPEEMLGGMPATLAGLPMPTLLIHGRHDVLPASFAQRAAMLIARASLITFDTGHFIPLDRPSEVAACLRNFFEENLVAMHPPAGGREFAFQCSLSRSSIAQSAGLNEQRAAAVIAQTAAM